MSLPTPPTTAQRDKENHPAVSRLHVVWSEVNEFHDLSSPTKDPFLSTFLRPQKSILKFTPVSAFPVLETVSREETPEPENPMNNASYLLKPISKIIDTQCLLLDLIQSYSILSARLRSCLDPDADIKTSWPLLEPLRANRDKFVDAVVRDLGRALVSPVSNAEKERRTLVMLPSPQHSPRKKSGMTADQIKYARDLCTTSHAVLKLLSQVLTIPVLQAVFTTAQLESILCHVIAIPLCSELPTINARKTYALAIWLLQTQRLPMLILGPARDRIANVVRRGIDGELGKEGKKGSASDGLKAIHDLSLYQPSTFVPAFSNILKSMLTSLNAPSLNLRVQACHAVAGFALASTRLTTGDLHRRIANIVSEFIKTPSYSRQSPLKGSSPRKLASPVKFAESPPRTQESALIRTLRVTIQTVETTHVAQGPIWGLSVLSSLIVLLGSKVSTDARICKIISTLLQPALRSKIVSVRRMLSLAWRVAIWAYLRPSLGPIPQDSSSDSEGELNQNLVHRIRRSFWGVLSTHLPDRTSGTALVYGLIDVKPDGWVDDLLDVIHTMSSRTPGAYSEAVGILESLASFREDPTEWSVTKILPIDLFNGNPLLAADFSSILSVVTSIISNHGNSIQIRGLDPEELKNDHLLEKLFRAWDGCVRLYPKYGSKDLLIPMQKSWKNLLKARMAIDDNLEDEEILGEAASQLVRLLQPEFWHHSDSDKLEQDSKRSISHRLAVVSALWTSLTSLASDASNLGKRVVADLMKFEDVLTSTTDERLAWIGVCAKVLSVCSINVWSSFFGFEVDCDSRVWVWDWTVEVRSFVWRTLASNVMEADEMDHDRVQFMSEVPFQSGTAWDLSEEDRKVWETLIAHGSKTYDCGNNALSFIDDIASAVSQGHDPTWISLPYVTEVLLKHAAVYIEDTHEVPGRLVQLVDDTLQSSYPPSPTATAACLWLLRSLSTVIDKCNSELIGEIVEGIQEGLCRWVADEYRALTTTDYNDVISLWETTLMAIEVLHVGENVMHTYAPLFESAFLCKSDRPREIFDAFDSFWMRMFVGAVSADNWPACIQEHFGDISSSRLLETPSKVVVDTATAVSISPSLPRVSNMTLLWTPDKEAIPITPHRSRKTPPFMFSLPPKSPVSPSSKRMVAPSSPGTPTKKRRIDDKENDPPSDLRSASYSSISILGSPRAKGGNGKRASSDEFDERPLKRRRSLDSFMSDKDNDMIIVSPTFSPLNILGITSETSPIITPSRRRLFMDAVVVPTIEQVYGRSMSLTPMRRRSPRRRSTLRYREAISPLLPRSRRSSVRALECDELSSDDDPHIGQVTPHHLMSPAPRSSKKSAVEDDEDVLGSDDSILTASPSRDFVRRRMQRTSSGRRV